LTTPIRPPRPPPRSLGTPVASTFSGVARPRLWRRAAASRDAAPDGFG